MTRRFPPSFEQLALQDAPPYRLSADEPTIGRFRYPVAWPDVDAGPRARLRLKQWHYQSFTTADCFFAFALVQLGYAAQLFVYVVDRHTRQRVELERISPLGRALAFAPSSLAGTSHWRSRGTRVDAGFDGAHFVRLDIPLGDARLSGQLRCTPDEALALAFPLAPDRLAYTHKAAAMRGTGTLRWGARTLSFDGSLAGIDYTRSRADRHTVWNWASFAGVTASGKRFGLNLSARVYDLYGQSMENAVWLDGRVHTLSAVRFDVPACTTDPWRIRSADGSDEVALEVTPFGERRSALDVKVIRSVFAQPFGEASGTVRGERIEGAFGVVEDHDALW